MGNFEDVSCAVCGNRNAFTYAKKGQFNIETNVVICKNCGFSYLNPRWTIERYNYFYAKEYDAYYREETVTNPGAEIEYRNIKIILERIKEFKIDLGKPVRILDIGCGMGHSLLYLKNKVFTEADYFAIEPSEFCIAHLKKSGINVLTNDVYGDWDKKVGQGFDFVIMRHVLEHFNTPVEILKKVKNILNDKGKLFIAVPDAMNPTKPLKTHYFRVVHVNYFTSVSLKNVLGLAGLNDIVMKNGDSHDPYEVFTFCEPGIDSNPRIIATEFEKQKETYDRVGKSDFYYTQKAALIRLLRKFKILR